MNRLKKTRFFSLGRKWVFTLALFVLVFAAASVVKIHAAGSGTGWLWGGGAELDGASPYDGINTNVGWISANRLNCDSNDDGTTDNANYANCPSGPLAKPITTDDRYGINIPPGNGDVTGYAWSEWIGWVQFDAAGPYPTTNCGASGCPSYSVKKDGINLHGWARITEIAREADLGNSGGWQGWVKLQGTASDGHPYGVTINDDGTGTFCKPDVPTTYLINGKNECHGWSDELGWIDFSQMKYAVVPSIELTPSDFSLGGTQRTLTAKIINAAPAGQTINFAKSNWGSNPNPGKFDFVPGGSAGSCTISSGDSCTIDVKANDRSAAFTAMFTASRTGFASDSSTGTIIQALDCSISCPSSVEVVAGGTKDYDVSVGATPAGCAFESCSIPTNSYGLISEKIDGNTCRVTSSAGADRFGSAVSTSYAGAKSCDTTVNVKGPGWIETNP